MLTCPNNLALYHVVAYNNVTLHVDEILLFVVARFTFMVASKGPLDVVIRAPLTTALGLHMLVVRASPTVAKRAAYKIF